jgi:hypothetical protein
LENSELKAELQKSDNIEEGLLKELALFDFNDCLKSSGTG